MKSAEEWINQVGEVVGLDMFAGDPSKPGSRTEELIKAIQQDARQSALREAAEKLDQYGHQDAARLIRRDNPNL